MTLVRTGENVLNLRHVVRTEEGVPVPGAITVHVARGGSFVLGGRDAQELRLALLSVCPPQGRLVSQGVVVDPGP